MAKRKYRVLSRNETLGTPQGGIVELDNKRLAADLVAIGALELVTERVKKNGEPKVAGDAKESHSSDSG